MWVNTRVFLFVMEANLNTKSVSSGKGKGTMILGIILCIVVACVHTRNIFPSEASFPSDENDKNIVTCSTVDIDNVWEREGDVMLRNGVRSEDMRWPNATVPFVIDSNFTDVETETIKGGIEEIQMKTCIKFLPYKETDKDYVMINLTLNETVGCRSWVGRRGGPQEVYLWRPGCIVHGTVVHELLHALGFYHQQNAHDRDKYVHILFENIKEGKESNFNILSKDEENNFSVPYDYNSIMHYGPYYFSKNDEPTMQPIKPNVTIGNREGLSAGDIEKLRRMYRCKKTEDLVEIVTDQ